MSRQEKSPDSKSEATGSELGEEISKREALKNANKFMENILALEDEKLTPGAGEKITGLEIGAVGTNVTEKWSFFHDPSYSMELVAGQETGSDVIQKVQFGIDPASKGVSHVSYRKWKVDSNGKFTDPIEVADINMKEGSASNPELLSVILRKLSSGLMGLTIEREEKLKK